MKLERIVQYRARALTTAQLHKISIRVESKGLDYVAVVTIGDQLRPRWVMPKIGVIGEKHQLQPEGEPVQGFPKGSWVTVAVSRHIPLPPDLEAAFDSDMRTALAAVKVVATQASVDELDARVRTAGAIAAAAYRGTVWEPWSEAVRYCNTRAEFIDECKTELVEVLPVTEVQPDHLDPLGQALASGLTQDPETAARLALASDCFLAASASRSGSNERFLGFFQVIEILAGLFEAASEDLDNRYSELEALVAERAPGLSPLVARLRAMGADPGLRQRFEWLAEAICAETCSVDNAKFKKLTRLRAKLVHGGVRSIRATKEGDPHEDVRYLAYQYLSAVARNRSHLTAT